MKEEIDWPDEILYWTVVSAGIGAAGYHSFVVFAMSDPPFVALLGAIALDGVTAYAMHAIKNWFGNQRLAGFVGIALFGVVSFLAQQIARHHGMGEALPSWLAFVSLFLVPLSSVGSVVALGVIRSLKESKNESASDDVQGTLKQVAASVATLVDRVRPPVPELSDSDRREEVTTFNSEVPTRRKAGRPPKNPPKAIGG